MSKPPFSPSLVLICCLQWRLVKCSSRVWNFHWGREGGVTQRCASSAPDRWRWHKPRWAAGNPWSVHPTAEYPRIYSTKSKNVFSKKAEWLSFNILKLHHQTEQNVKLCGHRWYFKAHNENNSYKPHYKVIKSDKNIFINHLIPI